MAGKPVGTMTISLDLETAAYTKVQQKILNESKEAANTINANFQRLGVTSDQIYAAMASRAEAAFRKIGLSAKSSLAEVERSYAAMVSSINISNQQMAKNPLFETLGIRSIAAIEAQKKAVIDSFEAIKTIGFKNDQERLNATRAYNNQLKTLNKEMVGDHERSMAAMTRAVLRMYAAYYVLSTAVQAIGNFFMGGVKAIDDMKISVVSVAAQITSMQGTTGDVAQNYKDNVKYAEALIPVLQQIDANSFANLSQIQKMNMAMTNQGVILDVNNKKQIESFTALTNAVALFTQEQDKEKQATQEIRSLMSGQIRAGDMVAIQMDALIKKQGDYKGGLKELVKEGKAHGDTLERMKPYLIGIVAASGDIQKTWMAVGTSIETVWNITQRGLFKDAYKLLIDSGMEATRWLKANQDEVVQYIKVAWGFIADIFIAAWNVLKGFGPILKDMAMLLAPIAYGWGGVLAALKPIGEVIGNAIESTYLLGKAIVSTALAATMLAKFDTEAAKLYWDEAKKGYSEVWRLQKKNFDLITTGVADSVVAYDKQYQAAKKAAQGTIEVPKIKPTTDQNQTKDSTKDYMESLRAKMQADKAYYDEQVKTADQVAKLSQRAGQDEFKTIQILYDTKKQALKDYLAVQYQNAAAEVAIEAKQATISKDGIAKRYDAKAVLAAKEAAIDAKYFKDYAQLVGEQKIAVEDANNATLAKMADLYKTIDQYSSDSLNSEIAAIEVKKKADARYSTATIEQRKVLDTAYATWELALRTNSALARYQIELSYLEMIKGPYSDAYKAIFEEQIQKEADLMAIKMQSMDVVFNREEFLAQKRRDRELKELSDKAAFYDKILGFSQKTADFELAAIKKRQVENTKLYGKEAADNMAVQEIVDRRNKQWEKENKNILSVMASTEDMFGSAAEMFDKESSQYKTLMQMKQVMHTAELAMDVAKQVSNYQTLISEIAKAKASGATAIAAQGQIPIVGFAMAAAMVAFLASTFSSLGVSFSGGGGSSASVSAAYGIGTTTLGGANDSGSQSIGNTWKLLEDTYDLQKHTLTGIYENMKQLNANITGIVKGIVQGNVGVGTVDGIGKTYLGGETLQAGIGSVAIGAAAAGAAVYAGLTAAGPYGWIAAAALVIIDKVLKIGLAEKVGGFILGGAETTQTASGIKVGGGSVIPYATTQTEHGGPLGGLFGGDRTSTDEYLFAVDATLTNLFYGEHGIYTTLKSTVSEIATALGFDVAQAENKVFDAFELNFIGKTPEEISKIVSEKISEIGDLFATEMFGDLIKTYQTVGEGALETASRLAIDLLSVTDILSMTGKTMTSIKPDAIALSESLIELAGGLDKLQESANTYYDKFFSDEEKQAKTQSQLTGGLANVGISLPDTREWYRIFVEGLDLATESGQEAYVAMLNLSGLADEYYTYLEDAAAILADAAKEAADNIAAEAKDLQDRYNAATDTTAQAATRLRDKIDPLNLALYDSVIAAEAAKVALDAKNAQDITNANTMATLTDQYDIAMGKTTADAVDRKNILESYGDNQGLISLQQSIWDLNDAALATASALEITNRTQALSIQLLEAQGRTEEALAAQRALDLAALDNDEQRQLQKDIWTLTDAAEALALAAEAEAEARRISDQNLGKANDLYLEYVRAQAEGLRISGDTGGADALEKMALEAERAMIIAQMITEGYTSNETEQQKRVWALLDANAAATKAMELLASKTDLQVELLDALGEAEGSLAIQRLAQLKALDESLQITQLQIWAVQDLTASMEKFKARTEQIAQFLDELSRSELAPVQSAEAWNATYEQKRALALSAEATDQNISDYLAYAKEYLTFQRAYGGDYQAIYDALIADMASLSAISTEGYNIAEEQLNVIKAQAASTIEIGNIQAELLRSLINAVLTGEPLPGHAAGGLTRGTSIVHGGEWVVPTYEPQRTSFLRDVGMNPETIGRTIAKYIGNAASGGSASGKDIHVHVQIDGREIGVAVAKQIPRDADLTNAIRATQRVN